MMEVMEVNNYIFRLNRGEVISIPLTSPKNLAILKTVAEVKLGNVDVGVDVNRECYYVRLQEINHYYR